MKAIPIRGGMALLPAKPGTCPLCATAHAPDAAHNLQSLFYGMRFKGTHGRDPTWADAVAHLPPETQQLWRKVIERHPEATWTEPPAGVDPIAEPLPTTEEKS